MTTVSNAVPHHHAQGWFTRCEAWLDDKGKGAWIAAMVLGFVFFWPVGLALLFYMIWSKKMFGQCSKASFTRPTPGRFGNKSSGNSAFDAYKTDTLRRLEQEQNDFESFLQRLRAAKDKAEFDQFMDDRASRSDEGQPAEDDDTATKPA